MKNCDIQAIIFDVGGVLALYKNKKIGVHETISKKLNINIDQYIDAIDTAYAKSITAEIPKKEAIKKLSNNLKVSEKKLKQLYIKSYQSHFKENKQLFKQVKKLKKLGYKTAILSDQWYLSQEALMPKSSYNIFDKVIVSCDPKIKMRKPNSEIYKLTLKKLNIKPNQALFIDNQEWNTKPAEKIGIKTILFKDNKQLFKHHYWKQLF